MTNQEELKLHYQALWVAYWADRARILPVPPETWGDFMIVMSLEFPGMAISEVTRGARILLGKTK